jgi:hypothetical protein
MGYPFASPAWFEALRVELLAALAHYDGELSFGERYVDGDDSSRGWHVLHHAGVTSFAPRPADDAAVELIIDLEVARRLCAPRTPELTQLERAALRDGRIRLRGDASTLPPLLGEMHDKMVAHTSLG